MMIQSTLRGNIWIDVCNDLFFWLVTGVSAEVLVYGALQIQAQSLKEHDLLGLELFTRLKGLAMDIITSHDAVGEARR